MCPENSRVQSSKKFATEPIPIDITLRYGAAYAVTADVEDCLGVAEEIARKIIKTHREDVFRIAGVMVEERELSANRIAEVLSGSER